MELGGLGCKFTLIHNYLILRNHVAANKKSKMMKLMETFMIIKFSMQCRLECRVLLATHHTR